MADIELGVHGRYTSSGHAAVRMATRMFLLKPYTWSKVRVHVHGRSHLRGVEAPYIAIANHSSHLDAAIIYNTLPLRLSHNLSVGAAGDYWFDHWYKSIPPVLLFNAFPVERSKDRTQGDQRRRGMAGRLLSSDVPILVFPEGTRTRTGMLGQFNPGTAALSISRGAPVIPIALVGAYEAWPSTEKSVLPGRPHVHVVFGTPMSALPGEIASEFATRLREVIIELHDSTARAYKMPTFDDYTRAAALRALEPGRSNPTKENE